MCGTLPALLGKVGRDGGTGDRSCVLMKSTDNADREDDGRTFTALTTSTGDVGGEEGKAGKSTVLPKSRGELGREEGNRGRSTALRTSKDDEGR